MNQNSQIQSVFQRVVQEGSELNLFNIYKGIPISYPAKIMEVSASSILISTDQLQIVCLYRERETYLQTPIYSDIIKARLIDLDVSNMEAVLSNFEVVKSRIGERTQVRVWPKEPILGRIQTKDLPEPLMGELADISRGGLAVYIEEKYFNPRYLIKDAQITTTICLPGMYEVPEDTAEDIAEESLASSLSRFDRSQIRRFQTSELTGERGPKRQVSFPESQVHGVIVYTLAQKTHSRYRIGIQINPNDASKSIISQFISQRQSEIIREIREISTILFSPSNT